MVVSRCACFCPDDFRDRMRADTPFRHMNVNKVYAIIMTETWMLSRGDWSTGMRLSILVLICARWLTRSVSPEMMSPKGIIDGVRRHKMLEVTSVARAMNSIVSCPLARGILPPMYHLAAYMIVMKIVDIYIAALAWTDMRRCACGKYSEVASKMIPKVRLKMKSILLYGME